MAKADAFTRPKEILFPIAIAVIVGALIAPHITRGDWNGAIGALLFAAGGGLIGMAIAARREKRQPIESQAKKQDADSK
jgi:hypothetical protein